MQSGIILSIKNNIIMRTQIQGTGELFRLFPDAFQQSAYLTVVLGVKCAMIEVSRKSNLFNTIASVLMIAIIKLFKPL